MDDIVRNLGLLTLGSRFRRIGERLQADTQQVIEEAGVSVQAAQYPFLAALDRAEAMTIGELAQSVGISQPGVTRTVSQLSELGLIDIKASPQDQRCRVVSLSEEGRLLVERSKRTVWPWIAAAVADLCAGFDDELLNHLAAIEDGLADRPLLRRLPSRDE